MLRKLPPHLPFAGERLPGKVVEGAGQVGSVEAVEQDTLAVFDALRILEAGQQGHPRYPVQEIVASGHDLEQGFEAEIADQILGVARQRRLEIEVPVAVHQPGLHGEILAASLSAVSPYFSARTSA